MNFFRWKATVVFLSVLIVIMLSVGTIRYFNRTANISIPTPRVSEISDSPLPDANADTKPEYDEITEYRTVIQRRALKDNEKRRIIEISQKSKHTLTLMVCGVLLRQDGFQNDRDECLKIGLTMLKNPDAGVRITGCLLVAKWGGPDYAVDIMFMLDSKDDNEVATVKTVLRKWNVSFPETSRPSATHSD